MTILRLFRFATCACVALACSSEMAAPPSHENVARAAQAAVASDAPWIEEAALPLGLWRGGDAEAHGATVVLDGDRLALLPPNWEHDEAWRAYTFVKRGAFWQYEGRVPDSDEKAANAPQYRTFRHSVALSGDMMLISTVGGPTFVYRATQSGLDSKLMRWSRKEEDDVVTPCSEVALETMTPYELSLSEDTALIGCHGEAVHVYVRNGDERLWPRQKLLPPEPRHTPGFGRAVVVAGNTVAIGSAGAVHLYVRQLGTWHHQQTLESSAEAFGKALSLSGDTLAVAGGTATAPAALLYARMGSLWAEQQRLRPAASGQGGFEPSISVSGDTLFFSPDGASVNVYSRLGSNWSPAQPLALEDRVQKRKVAVSGGHAVVSGPNYAAAFEASGSSWRAREHVDISSRQAADMSTHYQSISGTRAAIVRRGAERAIQLFDRSDSRWRSERLLRLDERPGYTFSPSIAENHLLVVQRRTARDASYAAPRVYSREGGAWSEPQELTTDDGAILEGGGAVFGDRVVIGDHENRAAYVFERQGLRWRARKLPTPPLAAEEKFGLTVGMDAQRVIVGSPTVEVNAVETDTPGPGAAYVFERINGEWQAPAKLTPAEPPNGSFGNSVAILDDVAVVGAPNPLLDGGPLVHTFQRVGSAWEPGRPLQPADPIARNALFGISVGLLKDTLAVGSVAFPGSRAYIYARNAQGWDEVQQISERADHAFGGLVSAAPGRLLLGGFFEPPRVYVRRAQVQQGGACSSASDCASGHCAAGVCCNDACNDECRACAMHLTNQPDGTCARKVPGARCSPDPLSCRAGMQTEYALASTCDVAGICQRRSIACHAGLKCAAPGYCPWRCNAFNGARHDLCLDGAWCDALTGNCVNKKPGWDTCDEDDECVSGKCRELVDPRCEANGGTDCKRSVCLGIEGNWCGGPEHCRQGLQCVDDVCCNGACTGPCESCNQRRAPGLCTPLPDGREPRAGRACQRAVDAACQATTCDGAHGDKCRESTALCIEAKCDGKTVYEPSYCRDGVCEQQKTKQCIDIVCDELTKDCKLQCDNDDDCPNGRCNDDKQCIAGRHCVNDVRLFDPAEGERQCPGRCENGQCNDTCSAAPEHDCSSGHVCVNQLCTRASGDTDGGAKPSPPQRDDNASDSCACRAAGGSTPPAATSRIGLLSLALALGLWRRRRARG